MSSKLNPIDLFMRRHGLTAIHVPTLGIYQVSRTKPRASVRGLTFQGAFMKLCKQLDLEGWRQL